MPNIAKLSALMAALALASLLTSNATAMCTQPGDPQGDVAFGECIDPDAARTNWRFVGRRMGVGVCPCLDGECSNEWTAERLFDPQIDEIPAALKEMCVFRARNNPPQLPSLENLRCQDNDPQEGCLAELEKDVLAMTFSGNQVIESLVWRDFYEQFLRQAGAITPLPPGTGTPRVRLTIIDTEPTGLEEDRNGPGISEHGYTLLNMARRLVCPANGDCGIELRSNLGLPLERCSTEAGASCQCAAVQPYGVCKVAANGGHIGTIGQLARAIIDEVNHWEASGIPRLVINLSVGWEPFFGGEPIASSSLPARSVATAVQHAVCRGAIVIAAAGNRAAGPTIEQGPLFPAAWERVPAPSPSECVALLGGPPDPTLFPVPAGTYRPLVYAAAAVNHVGVKAETRNQGEPRLVAYGDHAVAPFDNQHLEPTAIMTGSSVAAVVASAAAAAVWFNHPTIPAYDVMQSVYDAGINLPARRPGFCLTATGDCNAHVVRKTSVCAAVERACRDHTAGGGCPPSDCPIAVPVQAQIPVATLDAAFALDPVTDVSTFTRVEAIPECGANYRFHWKTGATRPPNPCPHLQFYAIQTTAWIHGQPSGQSCEVCTDNFNSPGQLYIEVDEDFLTPLLDITLLCGDNAFRIPGTLSPGQRHKIDQIPLGCETEDLALAARVVTNGVSTASVMSASIKSADQDDDTIQDALDNCYLDANADQRDSDGDSIGNRCDADFNNDCIVNVVDLGIMRNAFFSASPNIDLDGDGVVNVTDLGLLRTLFFKRPGPSGRPNLCSP